MPYEIIDDSEVDPGSPITHSLIRRLRDNPYELPTSIAVDGGIGVLTPCRPAEGANPAVATQCNDQGASSWEQMLSGGVLTFTESFPVVPRRQAFTGTLTPLVFDIFWSSPNSWVDPVLYFEGVYSGGTPTHLKVRVAPTALNIVGGTPVVWPGSTNGDVAFSGALATGSFEALIPVGGGLTSVLVMSRGGNSLTIELGATVDTDVISLTLKATRTSSGAPNSVSWYNITGMQVRYVGGAAGWRRYMTMMGG